MPGSSLLLDTNAVIALMRDDDGVVRILSATENVWVSLFTLGELQYGAAKSARTLENRRRLAEVMSCFRLMLPDQETARHYGDVFHHLKLNGCPIPTNDVWISALAIQYSIPVLTRDEHFLQVAGVVVREW